MYSRDSERWSWARDFSLRGKKEIIFPREGNNSQPPLLHQAVSIRWNFRMNSLTSERHPLLHSLSDVDRKPRPLGTRLYCSGVDVPLRRCPRVVRFENLWVWRETNHKLIWRTHSFICRSISRMKTHHANVMNQTRADAVAAAQTHLWNNSSLLSGKTTCAPLTWYISTRCSVVRACGFGALKMRNSALTKVLEFRSTLVTSKPTILKYGLWGSGLIESVEQRQDSLGLIYTLWSVCGFQTVSLKEIKLALEPKQQM